MRVAIILSLAIALGAALCGYRRVLFLIRIVKFFVIDVFGHPNDPCRLAIDWAEQQVWLEDPKQDCQ
jgi:hypothetical protein